MPLTQHYHTRDPIENLRVHVTLRKSNDQIANVATGDAETPQTAEGVGKTWDYCYGWQEKKLSTVQQQQQINHNAKSKQRSKRGHKKKKNEAGVADDTEDATEDTDAASISDSTSKSSVLCSYIDADNYVPKEELTRHVISSDPSNTTPATTHLVGARHHRLPPAQHALVTLRERNTERAWVRHHREESFRCMHIVASFGTSDCTEALDKVLCSIRFYAESGLLSVTPGFSTVLLESEKEDPEALIKGPKLSTYRVSIGGAQYEYTLDNVNDLLPLVSTTDQQLLRELQIQEERQDAACVAQLLFSGRDGGSYSEQQQLYYDTMKLSGVLKRRLVLVEVVEVRDLCCGAIGSSAPVFVELGFHFPRGSKQQREQQPHWRHRATGASKVNSLSGTELTNRTCLSLPRRSRNGSTLTVFNFHTKFDLELCKRTSKALAGAKDGSEQLDQEGDDGDEGSQMTASPVLSLAIFSRDSWGRKRAEGFGELTIPPFPGHYDRFVPVAKLISSVREQMEELFLGIDESEDAVANGSQVSAASTTLHSVNSRLGVQVQSTGASIRVRFNVVDQSPPLPQPHLPQVSSHPLSQKRYGAEAGAVLSHPLPGPLRVAKRSVNEILQAVRLEKRLSQAGTDPSSQSSSTSSATFGGVPSTVNVVLARLNAAKASSDNTTS